MFTNFIDFIYALIFIFVIFILTIVTICFVYKLRHKRVNPLDNLSFEQLFQIVNLIISNEVSLYERNIFDNGGKIFDKASYDNYYRDIMENVYKSFSDDLVDSITVYIDKNTFYSMVSREIMVYLNNKII